MNFGNQNCHILCCPLPLQTLLAHNSTPAGRGALDVKIGVVGLLEAAQALLNEGYQPKRTLMLAFGQDEESSGFAGAAQIAGGAEARCAGLQYQTQRLQLSLWTSLAALRRAQATGISC